MKKMLTFFLLIMEIALVVMATIHWSKPKQSEPKRVRYELAYATPALTNEEKALGVDNGQEFPTYEPDLTEMELTYYTDYGLCADSQTMARNGICAVSKNRIGQTAIVYSLDGEIVGIYECCDTGFGRREGNGKGTIQNGNCIDVFFAEDKLGKEFVAKYGTRVKVQFIDAKG